MRVLFVCLGNICRSPLAEAVLAHLVAQRPDAAAWTVDSAGTGHWHIGRAPDPRTLAVLAAHGLATAHRGRQVAVADFRRFDLLLAMDVMNQRDLARLRPPDAVAAVRLLGEWDPEGRGEVPDPYHGDERDFAAVHAQVERSCRAFLAAHPPR